MVSRFAVSRHNSVSRCTGFESFLHEQGIDTINCHVLSWSHFFISRAKNDTHPVYACHWLPCFLFLCLNFPALFRSTTGRNQKTGVHNTKRVLE